MTNFKKEQVVKCINTQGTKKLTEGKYYSVAEIVEGTNNIFVVNDYSDLEQFSIERFVESDIKIGDVIKGNAWCSGILHTGTVIEIDEYDREFTYKIKSDTSGEPWLRTSTVKKLDKQSNTTYNIFY